MGSLKYQGKGIEAIKARPGSLLDLTTDSIPDALGKVVYITGGASGIGLATAQLFASKNPKGLVIADFREPRPEILESLSPNTLFVQTDVTSWQSLCKSFDACVEKFGRIDYVSANAGIGEIEHLFVDEMDGSGGLLSPRYAAIDVNLKGVLSTVKLAVYWFRKLKIAGRIVMTSSMSGYETPGIPIYTASKHGVVGLLRGASLDLHDEFGVCLNSIAPGPVVTNLVDTFAAKDDVRARFSDELEEKYVWETQDATKPAIAAAYLLSGNLYGRSIAVHGGRYRDLESVYDAIRDDLLGSDLGIPPVSVKGWRNLFSCAF